MKLKFFLNALVFTILMATVYLLSYTVPGWIGMKWLNATAALAIIRFIFSCLWLLGITYHLLWDRHNASRTRSIILFFFIAVCAIAITWTIHAFSTLTSMYETAKTPSRGWRGNVNRVDSILGFTSIPNASGFHTFPIGNDIPMKYDANGFRVPMTYDHSALANKKPRILFLGCSFTYGDACIAEETFPFITEQQSGGYTINAAIGSYGLSQMYILAQSLIPKYKPDIVVFQHSPWLAERALDCYAPVFFGVLPTPYFDNNHHLERPLFLSNIFNYPMDHFRKTKPGFSDYLSFLSISFPLYLQDELHRFRFDLAQLFHAVPKPGKDEASLEQYVVHEVYQTCKANECNMILLNLSSPKYRKKPEYTSTFADPVPVANADSCLYASLRPGETYEKKYYHYRLSGNDSVLVDTHPNAAAHQVIANEIIRVIQSEYPLHGNPANPGK